MKGTIPQTFITELIERTDIVEVINTRVTLRKRGANYIACCPFHSEKTPSFTVSPAKQIYHCFGCGVSGNVITFLIEFDRLDFVEAIESLSLHLGMTIPRHNEENKTSNKIHKEQYFAALATASDFYQKQLYQHPQAKSALNYLKQRGLTTEIIKHYGLGYAPPPWDNLKSLISQHRYEQLFIETGMLAKKSSGQSYARFRDRIMFPIHDRQGRIIGFGGRIIKSKDHDDHEEPKYLNSPETIIFHKGQELYGLFQARPYLHQQDFLIIVEGYMDVIALTQFGIHNAIATLGTATTIEHLRRIFRYTSEIIFCFDGDQAGRKAAWRALENALSILDDRSQIKFILLPEGEDPDTLIREKGVDSFKQLITSAVPLTEFFFIELARQNDITTLDGQAKFTHIAAEYIAKMPTSIRKQLMIKTLSQKIRLDTLHLQAIIEKQLPPSQVIEKIAPSKESSTSQRLSPLRLAIALLLQHPHLVTELHNIDFLKKFSESGTLFLIELIDLLKKNPYITTGSLVEHWRTHKYYPSILKLANQELCIPEDGLVDELNAIWLRLQEYQHEQEIESLLEKLRFQGLEPQERNYLHTLLTSKTGKQVKRNITGD